ncbi:amino acid permease [Micromonospora acroterricola]|uniref:Amino acid permease n=1 Tax=Micromonospora acroterricola TaxID=2202421 RepID=A0A317D8C5_9ACTN|nr:amino acid permease [Micromonospora acroterricola]
MSCRDTAEGSSLLVTLRQQWAGFSRGTRGPTQNPARSDRPPLALAPCRARLTTCVLTEPAAALPPPVQPLPEPHATVASRCCPATTGALGTRTTAAADPHTGCAGARRGAGVAYLALPGTCRSRSGPSRATAPPATRRGRSQVLAVMLVAECAVALVFDAVMVGHPASGTVTFDTLAPSHIFTAGIGAALVTAVTGFVGFEGTVVFSEETKDPGRTVPRATYIAVAITGLLYGLSAWAMSVATGPDRIVEAARADGTDLIFNLVSPHLGTSVITIGRVLFITSLFAALLSFHHTVARYLFALGRERVLPAALGRTSHRTGAPKVGSIIQSFIAVAVIVGYAIANADPIMHLFFWITVTGGLGVLALMTVTSAAVVGYFARIRHTEGPWRALVAPLIATIALTAILAVTVQEFDTLLGVHPHSPLRWLFPATYAIVALLGATWALILRTAKPDVYNAIGLGAESATVLLRSPAALPQPA